MSLYTLTYSEMVQGWPSFYSYYPDWMIGMHNYFYTYKGGNLYRHNVNDNRNTFYEDWWTRVGLPGNAFTPTRLTSVFNDAPTENKLFKTIAIQGDAQWSGTFTTDIQDSGFIEYGWYEKKEQVYFSFIRNSGTTPASASEYPLRSVNGIGRSVSVTGPANATLVNFSVTPLVSIGSILSIGDKLYFAQPPYTSPVYCGIVTNISVNLPQGINRIEVDTTVPLATSIPDQDDYFMYIKNSVAESHGVLGHYCVFVLENPQSNKIELFTLGSNVMKSFP